MKLTPLTKLMFLAGAGLLAAGTPAAFADAVNYFQYQQDDLLMVFRKANQPDLEVNLGAASTFISLGLTRPGATISLTGFSPAQFAAAMGDGSSVSWAAMGAQYPSTGAYPWKTVWLTVPRLSLDTQTSPWAPDNTVVAASTIAGVAGVSASAGIVPWSKGVAFDPMTNSFTAAIIPKADGSSYSSKVGNTANLNGNSPSGISIENLTLATSPTTTRSDLYQESPNGTPTYLGFFDVNPNGTATFTAVPEPGAATLLGFGLLGTLLALRRRRA